MSADKYHVWVWVAARDKHMGRKDNSHGNHCCHNIQDIHLLDCHNTPVRKDVAGWAPVATSHTVVHCWELGTTDMYEAPAGLDIEAFVVNYKVGIVLVPEWHCDFAAQVDPPGRNWVLLEVDTAADPRRARDILVPRIAAFPL